MTQATISRDLRELGLQKGRDAVGRIRYVFVPASEERPDPMTACSRMLKEFGRGIQVAQNLLVVRCDPGSAPGIGRVIDDLEHAGILGCVAGDDTVIIVSKDSRVGRGRLRVSNRTGRLKLMEKERCILAYSGGLDTSALVPYMQEKFGYEIVCALVNVGRMKDLESLRMRGLTAGAIESIVIDAEEEFLTDYAFEALKANALYEGKYPLHSALSRPLISKKMVELAHQWGAKYIAHGCTAKGNDQVRMDVSIRCLDPDITVLGPAREWGMTRPQLLDYLAERGIDLPLTKKNPYSIDENLWGRAIECGELEDPWVAAAGGCLPVHGGSAGCARRGRRGRRVLREGHPGGHRRREDGPGGTGREDGPHRRQARLRSRGHGGEPAGGHQEPRDLRGRRFAGAHHGAPGDRGPGASPGSCPASRLGVDQRLTELIYEGLWFSPLAYCSARVHRRDPRSTSPAMSACSTTRAHCTPVGRRSPYSLYDTNLATYGHGDTFSHESAKGFIQLWGLPVEVYARKHQVKSERHA